MRPSAGVTQRRRRFSTSSSSSASSGASSGDDGLEQDSQGQSGVMHRHVMAVERTVTAARWTELDVVVRQEDMCRSTILSLEARLCTRYCRVMRLLHMEASREADVDVISVEGAFCPWAEVPPGTQSLVSGDAPPNAGCISEPVALIAPREADVEKPDDLHSPLNGDANMVLQRPPQLCETTCGISEDDEDVSPSEPHRDLGVVRLRGSAYGGDDEPLEQQPESELDRGSENMPPPLLHTGATSVRGDRLLHRAWCELNATNTIVAHTPQGARFRLDAIAPTTGKLQQSSPGTTSQGGGRCDDAKGTMLQTPHSPLKRTAAVARYARHHPSTLGTRHTTAPAPPVTPLPEAYRKLTTKEADALYFSCIRVPESFAQRQRREAAERVEEAKRTSLKIEAERSALAQMLRYQRDACEACGADEASTRSSIEACCDNAWWSLQENHLDTLSVMLHGLSMYAQVTAFQVHRDSMPWVGPLTSRPQSDAVGQWSGGGIALSVEQATMRCKVQEAWVREAIIIRLQGLLWLHLTQSYATSAHALRCQRQSSHCGNHWSSPSTPRSMADSVPTGVTTPRRSLINAVREQLSAVAFSPSPPRPSDMATVGGVRRNDRMVFRILPGCADTPLPQVCASPHPMTFDDHQQSLPRVEYSLSHAPSQGNRPGPSSASREVPISCTVVLPPTIRGSGGRSTFQ